MPSSERKSEAKKEAMIVSEILQVLPNEINGGIVAALLVNVLYRYGMESEWHKIIEAVNDTMKEIQYFKTIDGEEVLLN